MTADLPVLLERLARAIESVVPGLLLTPEIGGLLWLEEEIAGDDGSSIATGGGEWATGLVFFINYRNGYCGFEHASAGSDRDRLLAVARQLMSDVQDEVSMATTEPWPLVIANNRKDMATPDATIEGDDLLMWYGERSAPALRLPPVRLV